jgi:hypothetical protein
VPGVAKKLLIRPGDRVLVTNAPPATDTLLAPLPDGARTVTAQAADVTLTFAADDAAFRAAIPALRDHARAARAAWIAYPKLSSKVAGTLSRDVIRNVLEETTDIMPVTQVALDETWSALRVRPKELVGR